VVLRLRRRRRWRSHPMVGGHLLRRYRRRRSISFSTSGGGIPPLVLVLVRVVPTQWWGMVQLSRLRGFHPLHSSVSLSVFPQTVRSSLFVIGLLGGVGPVVGSSLGSLVVVGSLFGVTPRRWVVCWIIHRWAGSSSLGSALLLVVGV
jgi:hypothetical protein